MRYCSTGRSSNGSCSKNKINKNEILRLSFCNLCITWNYRACVFGVNLRLVQPFVCACIGGGVGGWIAALLGLKGTGMSITGIPGMLLYLNKQMPLYILVNVIAFAVAFVLTYFFGMKQDVAEAE